MLRQGEREEDISWPLPPPTLPSPDGVSHWLNPMQPEDKEVRIKLSTGVSFLGCRAENDSGWTNGEELAHYIMSISPGH